MISHDVPIHTYPRNTSQSKLCQFDIMLIKFTSCFGQYVVKIIISFWVVIYLFTALLPKASPCNNSINAEPILLTRSREYTLFADLN